MVRIKAPNGKKLRDTRTNKLHSEVITEERNARFFVVADSDADPVVETMDGVTLPERVRDLEDAVSSMEKVKAVQEYNIMMGILEDPGEEDTEDNDDE